MRQFKLWNVIKYPIYDRNHLFNYIIIYAH